MGISQHVATECRCDRIIAYVLIYLLLDCVYNYSAFTLRNTNTLLKIKLVADWEGLVTDWEGFVADWEGFIIKLGGACSRLGRACIRLGGFGIVTT